MVTVHCGRLTRLVFHPDLPLHLETSQVLPLVNGASTYQEVERCPLVGDQLNKLLTTFYDLNHTALVEIIFASLFPLYSFFILLCGVCFTRLSMEVFYGLFGRALSISYANVRAYTHRCMHAHICHLTDIINGHNPVWHHLT